MTDILTINKLRAMIKEALEHDYSYLLERPELLDEKSILKNKYPFKAFYIFGPAGSGKTFVQNNLWVCHRIL